MNAEELHPYVVRGLRLEGEDVLSVELVPTSGSVPAWTPGAHLALTVADGSTRQYSLCGPPGAASMRVAVRCDHAGRGGSRWVHEQLRPGDVVDVTGPRNHFRLEDAPEYVFVAGGIGITPILPMLAAADAVGARWTLHYYGRSLAAMAFRDELDRYGDRVRLHPAGDGRRDVATVLAEEIDPAGSALIYACGPPRLLDAVGKTAADLGVEDRLRTELFTAPVDDPPADGSSFEVRLADSGIDLQVPADRSILSVVAEAGIDVVSDCEEGICGTCETRVVDGSVDHRDHVLTPQEREAGDCMMICVSRAACPRLTLGL